MDQELNLTPTQALGVALSCAVPGMLMAECQEIVVGMVQHLKNMGFVIVKDSDAIK